MSNQTCETCKWYEDWECRRYPPTVVIIDPAVKEFWPSVKKTDWCGEHTPRKNLPVVEQSGGKLHFHVSGDNVWRADSGSHSFQIAKENDGFYTAMMYGHEPVVCSSYETAVVWCERMLQKYGS